MTEAAWMPSTGPAATPRRRRPMRGRMPLVELVLEMLWAALPSFEFDAEAWGLPRRDRAAPPPPAAPRPAAVPRASRRRPTAAPPPPTPRQAPPCLLADPALQRYLLDLGVGPGADLEAVRSAWRRLVREHHPDLFAGDPERQRRGNERVKDFNRAYREIRRRVLGGA